MKLHWKIILTLILILAVIGALIYWSISASTKPDTLDQFAQCLKDKGAVFYGAFWCQHCQSQKAMFGRSARLLPYVECSTPDGRAQIPVCTEKGIKWYPTWRFADGSEETGAVPQISMKDTL